LSWARGRTIYDREAMGAKCWITPVVVTITLGVAALPSAAQAFGQNGGTETGTLSVPANGMGVESTDTLPAKVKRGSIVVNNTSNDTTFFDAVTESLTAKPTLGARVITCVLVYANLKAYPDSTIGFSLKDPFLQDLFLQVCLRMAFILSPPPPPAADLARPAAGSCGMTSKADGITISRSGSGYSATVSGKTHKPKRRSPVIVTCKRSGSSLTISVRPRSRKATLKQVIGPKLSLGVLNPSSRSGKLNISFTVN
jgi:hypothetical protein